MMDNNAGLKLKPYSIKEIKILRENVSQRSQGDGEETEATYINKQLKTNDSSSKDSKYDSLITCSSNREISKALIPQPKLPNVSNIAQKLSKISLLTTPDPVILNSKPCDFDSKNKILLHPKELHFPKKNLQSSSKRKEPKFVPYEPYKGCIKPILVSKKCRSKVKVSLAFQTQPNFKNFCNDKEKLINNSVNEKDKFNLVITDFEKEKEKWEKENNSLKTENQDLQNQLSQSKKDFNQMQQQLSIQSQVNNELKKLLVASVGEDVQGRVQCLTEDKARMATMIRKYSEKVDKDYEEKERMSIQCDVWRSKFLASSLLIDELARWKGILFQHYQESQDSLKVLMQEREIIHHSLIHCYKHIHQILEAFDPLHAESNGIGILDASDVVSLSVASHTMAESLRDRLLGNLGRAVGNTDLKFPDETRTPGEKMAMQVLENNLDPSNITLACPLPSSRSSLLSRFHPNSRTDQITVNCCGQCSGDIKVV